MGHECNREIVSFRLVRACVRAVWLPSGIRTQIGGDLFPFALPNFPFSFVCAQGVNFLLFWIEVKLKWNTCELRDIKEK